MGDTERGFSAQLALCGLCFCLGVELAAVAGADALTAGSLLYNLSAATLGNIAGGILIVGVGYWIAYGREAHKHEVEAEQLAE